MPQGGLHVSVLLLSVASFLAGLLPAPEGNQTSEPKGLGGQRNGDIIIIIIIITKITVEIVVIAVILVIRRT